MEERREEEEVIKEVWGLGSRGSIGTGEMLPFILLRKSFCDVFGIPYIFREKWKYYSLTNNDSIEAY